MGLILNTKKVVQNNQEYLLGIFRISDVLKFTRYTEYTILGFDEENKPITNSQVQRRLDKKKVESISNFLINDPQAMFPTNIVIAIPNHAISAYEESDSNEITIELADTVESKHSVNPVFFYTPYSASLQVFQFFSGKLAKHSETV